MVEPEQREDLRVAVYQHFANEGRAPTVRELATDHGLTPAAVTEALRLLAAERHLVLEEPHTESDAVRIVMAHPFSAIPLGFVVAGPATLWWGGCAWDSFAPPHLLPDVSEVLVATECPGCRRALAFRVTSEAPPDGDEVAHFLVPAARMWDDVVSTCGNQRIFCSSTCVDRWLAASQLTRGYVMDLSTLWRLAQHWYVGRLDYGYRRRDPVASSEYLRNVGLKGAFWGN